MNFWFPKEKKIVIDVMVEYIEKNKKPLIDSFDKKIEYNSNIDPAFYDKKQLNDVLKIENNVLEEHWKTRILFENTPRGNIIMFYNVYKQGFSFYCDSNGIPYNILNSVAMKYVVTFKCRDFFVDNFVTGEANISPFIKIHYTEETVEKTEEQKKPLLHKTNRNAFVKLKNYRTAPSVKTETEEKFIKPVYFKNTFISLGKICNFNLLQTVKKENKLNGFKSTFTDNLDGETNLQKQVMSYKDYKLLSKGNP